MKNLRWRKWRQNHLIWLGGWERASCNGWRFRPNNRYGGWMKPYPISILNRLTIYSWGFDVKWWRRHLPGWYVFTNIWGRRLYWSPNGTLGHTEAKIYWQRKRKGHR